MREIFKNSYWVADEPKPKTKLQQEIDDRIFGKSKIKFTTSRSAAEELIKIIRERIDAKILSIKKAREDRSLDFEGDSNLESQIEMLEEWKEELLK
jgi:hypothetical protein